MPITRTRARFISEYAGYLQQGTGGLFLGAGLSTSAGYPTWRDLVSEMAEELELDADNEPDLASSPPQARDSAVPAGSASAQGPEGRVRAGRQDHNRRGQRRASFHEESAGIT